MKVLVTSGAGFIGSHIVDALIEPGHQAVQTVIIKSVAEPVFDARANILGSLNVILACTRFGRQILTLSDT